MKTKYPANANPGGRKAPPTMSPAIDVTSWDVMDPGFEARPTKRTVLYPTTAIAIMPRAGTKADAMSVHRRVSGGCRARTMKRYICAFALTPAVQKIVIRSGTNAVAGTAPPRKNALLPARARETPRTAAVVHRAVPIHLNRTPRRAWTECSGPYSSAPWCMWKTDIRLTMKLMTKTMTSPQVAAPVAARTAIAALGPVVDAATIEEIPTTKAKAPKMMSRIRFT